MYIPQHFNESDTSKLQQTIREYGLGLLIVADSAGIDANHVARGNPVWRRVLAARLK